MACQRTDREVNMMALVVVGIVVLGLAVMFGVGIGLQRLAADARVRALRRAGRTILLDAAIQRVLHDRYLFAEDRTSKPVRLWIVAETDIDGGDPAEIAVWNKGLVVENGSAALATLRADRALAKRILVLSEGVFID